MAGWVFRPPTVDEGPATWTDPLFLRLKLPRGITVLEGPPGAYRAVRFPTQDEIAASAPAMYMGGHEYVVDDATKAALIAGGVGVDESNFSAQ
ncbi:hypothetical protein ACIO1C_29655 [Streptomyces sp. NPDC087420]|uniref:hypothetical protein n=1 Tax=Streptomyces sp. NPDC087420 TaxID=3365785 RepID=UPI003834B12A